jgi:hypothetical protein
MGHQVHQLLATALSLALVALHDSDLTQRVLPSNPKLWQTPRQSWDPFQIRFLYPVMYRVCHMRCRTTHKIVFTLPFYRVYGAQPLCLIGCYTVGL